MTANIGMQCYYNESIVEIQLKYGRNISNNIFTAIVAAADWQKKPEVFWMHSAITIYFSGNICSVWRQESNINIID